MLLLFNLLSILTITANIILGILVLIKKPKTHLNRVFFVLCMFIALWVGANTESYLSSSHEIALWLARIAYIAAGIIAGLFLYFSIIYPEHKRIKTTTLIFIILPISFICFLSLTPLIVKDVKPHLFYGKMLYTSGELNKGVFLFDSIFILYFFIAFTKIIKKYRLSTEISKEKLKYFLIGSILSALLGAVTNTFYFEKLRLLTPETTTMFSVIGSVATLFFVGFTAYAITRYRLFGIRVILRKGTIYFITGIIAIALYAYLILVFHSFLGKTFNLNPFITSFFAAILLAIAFDPLKKWVKKIIDRIMYSEKKEMERLIRLVERKYLSKINLNKMAQEIAEGIKKSLPVDQVRVFIVDKNTKHYIIRYPAIKEKEIILSSSPIPQFTTLNKRVIIKEEIQYYLPYLPPFEKERYETLRLEMERFGAQVLIPIGTEDTLRGFILLGDKKNKEAYTKEEIEFLEKVRIEFSNYLESHLLYKYTVEETIAQRKKELGIK